MAEGALAPYAAGPSQDPAPCTLSREQKREVAALAAAGIASALFFLVPFLGASESPPLPTSRAIVAIAVMRPAPPSMTRFRDAARAHAATPRHVPGTELLAEVVVARTSTSPVESNEVEDVRHGPGLLTRALLGDGHYRVQPFPTVDDRN